MKKEILMLIIGILIGAIIATGVFLVLKGNTQNGNPEGMGRGGFEQNGEMPKMDGNEIRENNPKNNSTNNNIANDNTNANET